VPKGLDLKVYNRLNIEPTNRTAALAGIWTSLGLTPFEVWLDASKFSSALAYNLTWLSLAAVFFVLPAFFFVIGRDTAGFTRLWILDPMERAKYWCVVRRMLVWFVSAGITGSLISIAMNNIHIC
jgi:hypothetical protein